MANSTKVRRRKKIVFKMKGIKSSILITSLRVNEPRRRETVRWAEKSDSNMHYFQKLL